MQSGEQCKLLLYKIYCYSYMLALPYSHSQSINLTTIVKYFHRACTIVLTDMINPNLKEISSYFHIHPYKMIIEISWTNMENARISTKCVGTEATCTFCLAPLKNYGL